MSIERNKEVVREGWRSVPPGNLEGIAAMYHDDVVLHGAADGEIQGRDALIVARIMAEEAAEPEPLPTPSAQEPPDEPGLSEARGPGGSLRRRSPAA